MKANLDPVDASYLRRQRGFDGARQMIAQTGRGRAGELAKAQDHALLVGADPVKTRCEPSRDQNQENQENAPAAPTAAWQGALEAVLSLAQQFFQIRWLSAATAALSPGATAAALPVAATTAIITTTALIAPRHEISNPRNIKKIHKTWARALCRSHL